MRDAERSTQRAVQTMYADSVHSPCNHNRYATFQKGCRGTRGAAPYRSCLGAVHRSRLTAGCRCPRPASSRVRDWAASWTS